VIQWPHSLPSNSGWHSHSWAKMASKVQNQTLAQGSAGPPAELRSKRIKGSFILPPTRTCSLSAVNEMLARMNYLAQNRHKEILNNTCPLEF
jgi:hypothetical protein